MLATTAVVVFKNRCAKGNTIYVEEIWLSVCYLSDVVTRGVASQDYQRVVFIFIGEGEIRIGRESARTTGDHHVLRSAAAVHMADEKVTVALHLWVTLHYHAIITRPLSFFLPFLHYSSPS